MKKTEIKYGFSLMEMMVVMLVLSVVAAVTAPMVNKKMIDDSKNQSYFVPTGTDNSLVFNGNGSNSSFIIGDSKKDGDSRLQITTKDFIPQILLRYKDGDKVVGKTNFLATKDAIAITSADVKDLKPCSVTIGANAKSGRISAIAIGYNAQAGNDSKKDGGGAIAIGGNIENSEGNSYANTTASGYRAMAIGTGAQALSDSSIAIGPSAKTESATESIAIGKNTEATKGSSIAIGYNAKAQNNGAIALGSSYKFTNPMSGKESEFIAANASSQDSIAIGTDSEANGAKAITIGRSTTAIGSNNIAIGVEATTKLSKGTSSQVYQNIAIGYKAQANDGNQALAIGKEAKCTGANSIAMGNLATVETNSSVAIGDQAKVTTGIASIALGNATVNGTNSIAIGNGAKAATTGTGKQYNCIAIGHGAEAVKGDNSVAIGYNAETNMANQIVLGNKDTTVYIPGRLIVASDTVLSWENGATFVRLHGDDTKTGLAFFKANASGDGSERAAQFEFSDDGYSGEKTKDQLLEHICKAVYGMSRAEYFQSVLSDRRLKNVGKPFSAGLAEIKKLEVFNYTFKKDESKTPRVGVMAQDLQKIFPNAVTKGDDGFLRIRMEDMFYTMVNAIKELAAKFDLTDKKVAELEKQNKEILEQNAELKEQNKALADTIAELDKRLKKLEKAK